MNGQNTSQVISTSHVPTKQHFSRGVWFMILSLSLFAANVLILKYVGSHRQVSPWSALYVRAVIGFFVSVLLLRKQGGVDLKPMYSEPLMIWRGLTGFVGTAIFYWTIPILGAGRSTLIGSMYIPFAAVFAVFLLKERLGWDRVIWIMLSLVGVLMLTGVGESFGPGGFHMTLPETLALLAALVSAASVIIIRRLTRRHHSGSIYLCQCVYLVVPLTPFAFFSMEWPGMFEMGLISLAALAAGYGHIAMNEGYRFLPVATGASTQMALPVMASIGGVVLFAEHFTGIQLTGAVLIVIGCYWVVAGRR